MAVSFRAEAKGARWATSTGPQPAPEAEGMCLEMRDENTPLAPLEYSSNMSHSPYTSGGPYQVFR